MTRSRLSFYKGDQIQANLSEGKTLALLTVSTFIITIVPPKNVNIIMVAPKGTRTHNRGVRSQYVETERVFPSCSL